MALAALLLALAACTEVLPVGPRPVVGEASDDEFTFVVRSPADSYANGQPVEVLAELVYQGPKNRETIHHGGSPVGWEIVQLDGRASMAGAMDTPCLATDLAAGEVRQYRFEKSGSIDDAGPFTRTWFEQDALTLPPGRWRFTGQLLIALGDCGGERHDLEASIEIIVRP